jgi:predicted  nucleic acid-binding Zn-ribbon protein
MTEATELVALERNLKEAQSAFERAAKALSSARSDEIRAKNDLNAAQKQIDNYLKKLRDGAPKESDWGAERMHRFAVREEAA